jgi:hypothetical protein
MIAAGMEREEETTDEEGSSWLIAAWKHNFNIKYS